VRGRLYLVSLAPLLAGAAAQTPDDAIASGSYYCTLKHEFDGTLELSQQLTADGRLVETRASWVEPRGLWERKRKADRDISNPAYMTISVGSRASPLKGEPGWFDMADARVQITVVTRRKLHGAAAIDFRRPSRAGDRYEDALSVSARNSRGMPWSIAALPYRVLDSFAQGERELDWMLLRWVGGDLAWDVEEHGTFDLRKVSAFAEAAEAARPALAAQRAAYREQCEFTPAAEENQGAEI
jgi:hypothetical protein